MPPRIPRALTLRLLRVSAVAAPAPRVLLPHHVRAISTTPQLLRIRKDPNLRRGQIDEYTMFTLDENIDAPRPEQLVLYIDAHNKNHGLKPLPELLDHLDRRSFHLHCINPQASGEPYTEPFIVKLVPREYILARVEKALEAETVAKQKKKTREYSQGD